MKKLAVVLSLCLAGGLSLAQEAQKAEPAAPEKAFKTHEVDAEIVSFDATAKTLTIKGEKENKVVPVDEKALAVVKQLKAGQKTTLICRDSEKGEHLAVAGVKAAAKAPAPEKQ